MKRLFCLSLVVALASYSSTQAQAKKDPPKNFHQQPGHEVCLDSAWHFSDGQPEGRKRKE